jgi:hypothetical protein
MKTTSERRGYVILVGMSFLLTILTIMFCARIVDGANQRTCDVIHIALIYPVPKPVGKQDTVLKQSLYRRYLAYEKLSQELKCPISR